VIKALGTGSYHGSSGLDITDVSIEIGNYTSIGQNVNVMPGHHACVMNRDYVSTFPFGNLYDECAEAGYLLSGNKVPSVIRIFNDVWIGNDVILSHGITIGNGAIIGQGTMVTKDVPDFAIVAGNPGEIKGTRFNHTLIGKLRVIQWWNWSLDTVKSRIEDFREVHKFVTKYYAGESI